MRNYQLMADLSSNNAGFDAARYASAGHTVVAIKATESDNYLNPYHAKWTEEAHAHGLSVIHYHFSRPEAGNPDGQMNFFWNSIKDSFRRPGDYVALDVETGTYAEAHNWTRDADSHLRLISKTHPWVYAPLAYYDGAVLHTATKLFWIAAWGSERVRVRRGDRMVMRQYSDGRVGPGPHEFAGIPGSCDGSAIDRKTAKQFKKDYDKRRHPCK